MNIFKLSLLPLFALLLTPPANTIVLRGVVSEVRDGETIVVTANNQKVTVILKGVDAPELKQDYGGVAHRHLASLVLHKTVDVDFTEMRGANVVGKVICNNADIGLQVIRDGVAWYAVKSDHSLSDVDRSMYLEAERAARKERRGLWHDVTPMPPWEWRRTQAAKNERVPTNKSNRTQTALSREDVLFGKRASGVTSSGDGKNKTSLAKPSGRPLNTPGLDYNFQAYLNQGRVSIVYFYADWCPACRQLNPMMDEINKSIPDMQVLFMNIGEWNTPVAQQYGVRYVPYLMIYDKSGSLVASGRDARGWMLEALRQRASQ